MVQSGEILDVFEDEATRYADVLYLGPQDNILSLNNCSKSLICTVVGYWENYPATSNCTKQS